MIKALCQSEACKRGLREFWEKKRQLKGAQSLRRTPVMTRGNLEPEAYDDQEAIRLHRQRLVDGYAAACERLPRGYTMSFATWIQTIGDGGTVWADMAWQVTPKSEVQWRL